MYFSMYINFINISKQNLTKYINIKYTKIKIYYFEQQVEIN